MPEKKKENRTRVDYLEEEFWAPLVEQMDDLDEDFARRQAKSQVTREDERIWAWYNDPLSDLTQVEARDRAQNEEYGRYNLSQSGLSRKLSNLDETMFTGELECLGEDVDGPTTLFTEEWYDAVATTGELLDLYRQTLARFICDLEALSELGDSETPTPEWVRDRFPGVNPNLGRKLGKRMGYHKEGAELHDVQDWDTKQSASGDD